MRRLALLAAVSFALGPTRTAGGEHVGRTVTVCSDPWMPFTGDGAPGGDEGYVVKLAREALARRGHQVRYVVVPWSRCLADVEAGRWDAVACADPRESPGVLYPAEPVGETLPTLFTGPGSTWRYTGPASLDRIRLGAIQHYSYEDALDAWILRNRGEPRRLFLAAGTDPLRRLLDMLAAGRIDAFVENSHVARWAARRHGLGPGALRTAGVAGPPIAIYVAFSRAVRGAPGLVRDFDAGMRALYAEGRVAAIAGSYHVEPWPRAGSAP